MTDPDEHVRELVRRAGALPSRGPDLHAVTARAAVLRRRDRAVRGALVVSLTVMMIPLTTVLASRDTTRAPRPLAVPSALPSADPTHLVAPVPRRGGVPEPAGPPSSVGTSAPGPVASSPSRPAVTAGPGASSGAAPAPAPAVGGDYPDQSSCSVDTTSLTPGQSAQCQFTATAAGGWRITHRVSAADYREPYGRVTVERSGVRRDHELVERSTCRSHGIEPGDKVTVVAYQHEERGYRDVTVSAGEGLGCPES